MFYFWANVFAFGQLKMYVFRSSLWNASNKIGVGKNHRTIKIYFFHSSTVKIEFLDLFQPAVWWEQMRRNFNTTKLNIIAPQLYQKPNPFPGILKYFLLNIFFKSLLKFFFSRDRYSQSGIFLFKAWVQNLSLFLKQNCISSLFQTKYIEKKFNLQLFFLPIVSWTFTLAWATTRCPPS